jgi:hypothetical protein
VRTRHSTSCSLRRLTRPLLACLRQSERSPSELVSHRTTGSCIELGIHCCPPASPVFGMHFARALFGAKKLVAITSKRGNKNFYKGRGAPAAGHRTKWGGYHIDAARVATITFAAPDLTGFAVSLCWSPHRIRAGADLLRRSADALLFALLFVLSTSHS